MVAFFSETRDLSAGWIATPQGTDTIEALKALDTVGSIGFFGDRVLAVDKILPGFESLGHRLLGRGLLGRRLLGHGLLGHGHMNHRAGRPTSEPSQRTWGGSD
jgi:hypothetical protein